MHPGDRICLFTYFPASGLFIIQDALSLSLFVPNFEVSISLSSGDDMNRNGQLNE